jgi:uncharacterized protein
MESVALTVTNAGTVRFSVQARPRAKASRVTGVRGGALVVHLAAPPVDGKANDALIEALADALDMPRRDVMLVRGDTARHKVIEVRGVTLAEVEARLARMLNGAGPLRGRP